MGSIGLVVLAAGASKRLGTPKQLLKFQEKTLLQHVLDQTQESEFATKVLVLGAYSEQIQESIDPATFNLLINEGWKDGMASSLTAGLSLALTDCPGLEHLLFLLSDQPFVSNALIQSLIARHLQQGNLITACRYQGQLGVPAIFEKSMFLELLQLQGDRGANGLIRSQGDRVGELPFELGKFDVDTEEDLRRINDFRDL